MDKLQMVTEKVIDIFDDNDVSPEEALLIIERITVAIVVVATELETEMRLKQSQN